MINGFHPRKSKPKKSKRRKAIEASFDALCEIANEGRIQKVETEDERFEFAMAYLEKAELPLGDDTAEYFLPDEDEMIFLLASATSADSFAHTLAAMKASAFMHGYLHAQIEDGVRDEAGKVL
jgi:hypothetical protein